MKKLFLFIIFIFASSQIFGAVNEVDYLNFKFQTNKKINTISNDSLPLKLNISDSIVIKKLSELENDSNFITLSNINDSLINHSPFLKGDTFVFLKEINALSASGFTTTTSASDATRCFFYYDTTSVDYKLSNSDLIGIEMAVLAYAGSNDTFTVTLRNGSTNTNIPNASLLWVNGEGTATNPIFKTLTLPISSFISTTNIYSIVSKTQNGVSSGLASVIIKLIYRVK